ncbi:MAG: ribonuclease HII [Lachnospiraceae bacterium]|nr:ribonuclease HII [Lachnospiraceae bacterium]
MSISISEITKELKNIKDTDKNNLSQFVDKYNSDERNGVVTLINKANKKINKIINEEIRTHKMYEFERKYYEQGYKYICGIDEVGRGPLAGPVVACAVILPDSEELLYLNDSKQVSKQKREELYDIILDKAIACEVGIVSWGRIDEINILQATYEAMRAAISKLKTKPDLLLNDAVKIPEIDVKQVPIIKGDTLSASIAAASIVAKVTRDRMMEEYARIYPGYDFENNMGYGTKKHLDNLKAAGPCDIHRRTFIKNLL